MLEQYNESKNIDRMIYRTMRGTFHPLVILFYHCIILSLYLLFYLSFYHCIVLFLSLYHSIFFIVLCMILSLYHSIFCSIILSICHCIILSLYCFIYHSISFILLLFCSIIVSFSRCFILSLYHSIYHYFIVSFYFLSMHHSIYHSIIVSFYFLSLYHCIVLYIKGTFSISRGSCGLMVESRTRNPKVVSSSLGPAGTVGGGSECTALSPPSIPRLRCPWARHRSPDATA